MRGILFAAASLLLIAPLAHADDMSGTTSLSLSPSEGNSTTSLPAAVRDAQPRTIKGEVYIETDVHTKTAATQDFLGVRQIINQDSFWGVRQNITTNNPVNSKSPTYTMGDTYLEYTNVHMLKSQLASDENLIGFFRLYLPTGEDARFGSHEQGSAYAWLIATKSVGTVDFNAHLEQRLYDQVQDGFVGPDGKPVANQVYDFNPWAEIAWNITPKFQWVNSVGWEGTIDRHFSSAINTYRDYNITSYFAYKPIPDVWLATFFLDDLQNNTGHPLVVGNADDMTVELIAFATL